MKKMKLFLSLALALTFALTACNKDEDDNNSEPQQNQMQADDAGGESFDGTAIATEVSGKVSITGTTTNGRVISLLCDLAVGTYTFADGTLTCTYSTATTVFNEVQTGVCEITEYNSTEGTVSGTFSFTAEDGNGNSVGVAGGSFTNVTIN